MSFRKIDSTKIESAIADFEAKVDFEFIPVITNKSSYVDHIQWILSLLFLLVFVGVIDLVFYDSWSSKTPYYIAAPFLAILLGSLLDKSDIVDRFFISKAERTRQVQEKAQRVFFLKRLDQVKSQNALLLFVSIMERKIVLLPDPRLSQISKEKLSDLTVRILGTLQNSFKSKKYEEGLLQAISLLKSDLESKFPRAGVDLHQNQIPNKLIWWDE